MKIGLSIHELDKASPFRLAGFMMLGTIACIVLFGYFSADEEIEWLIAIAGLLLFAWVSAVLGFFNPAWGKYALQSVISYLIMVVVLLGVAFLVSTTSIQDMRVYQSMLLATSLFFGVAIVVSRVIQGITQFFSKH